MTEYVLKIVIVERESLKEKLNICTTIDKTPGDAWFDNVLKPAVKTLLDSFFWRDKNESST